MKLKILVVVVILFIYGLTVIYTKENGTVKYINVRELNENSFILDVRTKEEIDSVRLTLPFVNEDSTVIDVNKFIDKYNLQNKETTIIILCYSGRRAEKVAKQFIKVGYDNIKVVKGGIQEIEKEGVKVLKGK